MQPSFEPPPFAGPTDCLVPVSVSTPPAASVRTRWLADLMPNTLPARGNVDAVSSAQVGQQRAQRPLDRHCRIPKLARQFWLAYSGCFPTVTASKRRP